MGKMFNIRPNRTGIPGTVLTTREFLYLVNDKTPGIEKICTHPKEKMEERLEGLMNGLVKSGIQNKGYAYP